MRKGGGGRLLGEAVAAGRCGNGPGISTMSSKSNESEATKGKLTAPSGSANLDDRRGVPGRTLLCHPRTRAYGISTKRAISDEQERWTWANVYLRTFNAAGQTFNDVVHEPQGLTPFAFITHENVESANLLVVASGCVPLFLPELADLGSKLLDDV